MEIVEAIAMLASMIESVQKVATVIKQASDEGRPLNVDELKQLQAADDSARQVLEDAISEAEAGGAGPRP